MEEIFARFKITKLSLIFLSPLINVCLSLSPKISYWKAIFQNNVVTNKVGFTVYAWYMIKSKINDMVNRQHSNSDPI